VTLSGFERQNERAPRAYILQEVRFAVGLRVGAGHILQESRFAGRPARAAG